MCAHLLAKSWAKTAEGHCSSDLGLVSFSPPSHAKQPFDSLWSGEHVPTSPWQFGFWSRQVTSNQNLPTAPHTTTLRSPTSPLRLPCAPLRLPHAPPRFSYGSLTLPTAPLRSPTVPLRLPYAPYGSPTVWGSTVSGYRFWIWGATHLDVYTLGVYSGGLLSGGLQSHATNFGSGEPLTYNL